MRGEARNIALAEVWAESPFILRMCNSRLNLPQSGAVGKSIWEKGKTYLISVMAYVDPPSHSRRSVCGPTLILVLWLRLAGTAHRHTLDNTQSRKKEREKNKHKINNETTKESKLRRTNGKEEECLGTDTEPRWEQCKAQVLKISGGISWKNTNERRKCDENYFG